MLAVLAATAYRLTPHGALSDFRVDGKNLIAMNANGRELWRHVFELPLIQDAYVGDNKARRNWIGDVAGRGSPGLLFEHVPVNRYDVGVELFCVAMDGRTLWRFKPGRPVTDGGGDRMLPPYGIDSLHVLNGRTTADTRIAVTSLHWLNQPAQVAILLPDGRVIGEYWHPGHFNHSTVVDLYHDGAYLARCGNSSHEWRKT
jgi:hypothetical protein